MANANLFHSLGDRKIAQTQQHTGYEVLETVSSRETVFQLRALLERRYSLCQHADDKKGRISRSAPVELKRYFKYFTDLASCVLARTPQGPRQAAPPGTSSLQPWFPSPSRRTSRPSLPLQQHQPPSPQRPLRGKPRLLFQTSDPRNSNPNQFPPGRPG